MWAVLSHTVVCDCLQPHVLYVACQAPLSMGILQARILEWVAMPSSLFATPWIAARQASLSITNSQSLPKLMSIKPVMPSGHLVLCQPLLLPSILPRIRVFSSRSVSGTV